LQAIIESAAKAAKRIFFMLNRCVLSVICCELKF